MSRIILISILFALQACQEQNTCDNEFRLEQQLRNAKLRITELERRSCVELIVAKDQNSIDSIESGFVYIEDDVSTCVADLLESCTEDKCVFDLRPHLPVKTHKKLSPKLKMSLITPPFVDLTDEQIQKLKMSFKSRLGLMKRCVQNFYDIDPKADTLLDEIEIHFTIFRDHIEDVWMDLKNEKFRSCAEKVFLITQVPLIDGQSRIKFSVRLKLKIDRGRDI